MNLQAEALTAKLEKMGRNFIEEEHGRGHSLEGAHACPLPREIETKEGLQLAERR